MSRSAHAVRDCADRHRYSETATPQTDARGHRCRHACVAAEASHKRDLLVLLRSDRLLPTGISVLDDSTGHALGVKSWELDAYITRPDLDYVDGITTGPASGPIAVRLRVIDTLASVPVTLEWKPTPPVVALDLYDEPDAVRRSQGRAMLADSLSTLQRRVEEREPSVRAIDGAWRHDLCGHPSIRRAIFNSARKCPAFGYPHIAHTCLPHRTIMLIAPARSFPAPIFLVSPVLAKRHGSACTCGCSHMDTACSAGSSGSSGVVRREPDTPSRTAKTVVR